MFTRKKTGASTNWYAFPIKKVNSNFIELNTYHSDEILVNAIRYNWKQQPCAFKLCALYSENIPAPAFIYYLKNKSYLKKFN